MSLKINASFPTKLEIACEAARGKGKRIGITNGCFDLLHEGHIHLLKEARKHCDFLVVAVNNDESVTKLKGKGRPIETRSIRYQKILNTHLANMLTSFDDERELLAIMKEIIPDVLIKGADYHNLPITGGGYIQSIKAKVVLIPLLHGFSTTNLINATCV